LELEEREGQWVLRGADIRAAGWIARFVRGRAARVCVDWSAFELLIGHGAGSRVRPSGLVSRRLKPAQIADLLEEASKAEGSELLETVHADPELEADVFEELDEDLAARLLGARTDAQIAAVLSRMGADDAADAVADLPQRRRQAVLDLLPAQHRRKVLALLGFNPTSAGGLMGVDLLALPPTTPAAEALAAVAEDRATAPEALHTIHVVDSRRRLLGVVPLVAVVRADSQARLEQMADLDPVAVGPDADIEDVALLMADYNLTTVPVTGDDRRLLGVITVDDLLETVIPIDWRRREAPAPRGDLDRDAQQSGVDPADGESDGEPRP
jgi:Mg/Co/Ni transporter MgtE